MAETTTLEKVGRNKEYELRIGKDAVFYCTCPSWRFQKAADGKRGPCKHMLAWLVDHKLPMGDKKPYQIEILQETIHGPNVEFSFLMTKS